MFVPRRVFFYLDRPPFLLLHDSSCRWLRLGNAGVTEQPGTIRKKQPPIYTPLGHRVGGCFSPTLLKKICASQIGSFRDCSG